MIAIPEVPVVTDQDCFGEEGGFDRLTRWPVFAGEIAAHYAQQVEWQSGVRQHWFSRSEAVPRFRMYVRH